MVPFREDPGQGDVWIDGIFDLVEEEVEVSPGAMRAKLSPGGIPRGKRQWRDG